MIGYPPFSGYGIAINHAILESILNENKLNNILKEYQDLNKRIKNKKVDKKIIERHNFLSKVLREFGYLQKKGSLEKRAFEIGFHYGMM